MKLQQQMLCLLGVLLITTINYLHGTQSFLTKSRVIQLIKKFPASYGNRKFITLFTRASILPYIYPHVSTAHAHTLLL